MYQRRCEGEKVGGRKVKKEISFVVEEATAQEYCFSCCVLKQPGDCEHMCDFTVRGRPRNTKKGWEMIRREREGRGGRLEQMR